MNKIIILLVMFLSCSVVFSQKKSRIGYQLEYSCYNENVLIIHTNQKLSDEVEASYFSKTKFPLVKSMLTIDGITEVKVDQYEIHLTKANLFQWKSLFPKIKATLSNEFNSLLLAAKAPIYGSCLGLMRYPKQEKSPIGKRIVRNNWYGYSMYFGSLTLTATDTY